MKKTNWLLVFMFFVSATAVSTSCKNRKTESTIQQQDKTTNAPVEISSDENLKRSVNEVLKGYSDVQAEIKDGVVTLRGSVKQSELQILVSKMHELKPKKVETAQLVIKT